MQIHPLQARSDNWMYLVIDESTSEAAVVDPYDWKKMLAFIEEKKAKVNESDFRHVVSHELIRSM
jgi:hydroxyacylglutathione hydrolase